MIRRYFLTVSYDGTHFHGSQIQGDQPTVQLAINIALSTLLRSDIQSYGASRTDEGVHAIGNVYHFDTDTELNHNFMYRLNAILPQGIAAIAIRRTKSVEANCRFDAISRRYRYQLHFHKNPFAYERSYFFPYQIDMDILAQSAYCIKGHTNFETFAKRNAQVHTYNCTIFQSEWQVMEDGIAYIVVANRFLRGMVRALVGTQLQVARGKYDVKEFNNRILSRNCQLADFSVPGFGLYLEHIEYPADYFDMEILA